MNIEPCNVNRNSLRGIDFKKQKELRALYIVFNKLILDELWVYELKAILKAAIRWFIVKILAISKS